MSIDVKIMGILFSFSVFQKFLMKEKGQILVYYNNSKSYSIASSTVPNILTFISKQKNIYTTGFENLGKFHCLLALQTNTLSLSCWLWGSHSDTLKPDYPLHRPDQLTNSSRKWGCNTRTWSSRSWVFLWWY